MPVPGTTKEGAENDQGPSAVHFESGPPVPREEDQVNSGDTISTTKHEEWVTKKKVEVTTTKQVETRVKRQVLLEDGNVIEDSGPVVTSNTTENTKRQESEQTEHRKSGEDPPAGEGWMTAPGGSIIKETKEKKVNMHDVKENLLETEEVQHLGEITNEDLLKAIQEKGDVRQALIKRQNSLTDPRHDVVPAPEKRIIHQSKKHHRTIDTEDVNEVSKIKDAQVITETKKTQEREEYHNEVVPDTDGRSSDTSSVKEVTKESAHNYSHTKNEDFVDYVAVPKGGTLADGVKVGEGMHFVSEDINEERKGDQKEWNTPFNKMKKSQNIGLPKPLVGRDVSPERKDALTREPLDLDLEEETRKSETFKWLEHHFGSDSASSRGSQEGEQPIIHSGGNVINITVSPTPTREADSLSQPLRPPRRKGEGNNPSRYSAPAPVESFSSPAKVYVPPPLESSPFSNFDNSPSPTAKKSGNYFQGIGQWDRDNVRSYDAKHDVSRSKHYEDPVKVRISRPTKILNSQSSNLSSPVGEYPQSPKATSNYRDSLQYDSSYKIINEPPNYPPPPPPPPSHEHNIPVKRVSSFNNVPRPYQSPWKDEPAPFKPWRKKDSQTVKQSPLRQEYQKIVEEYKHEERKRRESERDSEKTSPMTLERKWPSTPGNQENLNSPEGKRTIYTTTTYAQVSPVPQAKETTVTTTTYSRANTSPVSPKKSTPSYNLFTSPKDNIYARPTSLAYRENQTDYPLSSIHKAPTRPIRTKSKIKEHSGTQTENNEISTQTLDHQNLKQKYFIGDTPSNVINVNNKAEKSRKPKECRLRSTMSFNENSRTFNKLSTGSPYRRGSIDGGLTNNNLENGGINVKMTSTLDRHTKPSTRGVSDANNYLADYGTRSHTLPRKMPTSGSPRKFYFGDTSGSLLNVSDRDRSLNETQLGGSMINVSIINNVNNSPSRNKPLARSQSFNIQDSKLITSRYGTHEAKVSPASKSSPYLNRLSDSTPLKSPGIINSIYRSQSKLNESHRPANISNRISSSAKFSKSTGTLINGTVQQDRRVSKGTASQDDVDSTEKRNNFLKGLLNTAPELFMHIHGNEDLSQIEGTSSRVKRTSEIPKSPPPPLTKPVSPLSSPMPSEHDHVSPRSASQNLFTSTPNRNRFSSPKTDPTHVTHAQSFRSATRNDSPGKTRISVSSTTPVVLTNKAVIKSNPSFQSLSKRSYPIHNGHAVTPSPMPEDYTETVRITSTSPKNSRNPTVTNMMQSYTKRTIPNKDGYTTQTVESSEKTTMTKNKKNSEMLYPKQRDLRYIDIQPHHNKNGSVVIEVRDWGSR